MIDDTVLAEHVEYFINDVHEYISEATDRMILGGLVPGVNSDLGNDEITGAIDRLVTLTVISKLADDINVNVTVEDQPRAG